MHPAPSIILFTSFSGLGFGLLFWLGIGQPSPTGWVAFVFYFIAYALSVGGLLASVFHLGHPERSLRAFTQWRSSWLSREAVISTAALLLMAVTAAAQVFTDTRIAPIGILGGLAALVTVFCTSMIYAQLRTVPRWNHWINPVLFLTFSIAGGALLAGQTSFALPLIALAGLVQIAAWVISDGQLKSSGTTLASATGLGAVGEVTSFAPPHTGSNYLLREMVFVVGRKHALKLRVISITLMAIIPVAYLLFSTSHILAGVAVLCHIAGVLVSRWLFFAEAEHVVGLYYGKR